MLKPGGRLMISDMVLIGELPEAVLKSAAMYAGCIAGALRKEDYLGKIRQAGFEEIVTLKEDSVRLMDYVGSDKVFNQYIQDKSDEEIEAIDRAVVSIKVSARKP